MKDQTINVIIEDNIPIDITLSASNSHALEYSDWVWQASPVESPNGSRTTFTLPNSHSYRSGKLKVYRDGIFINGVAEASSTTFTMPDAPLSDETITMDYIQP